MSDIDESKAPLLDHLIELRRRLMYCIAAIGIAFVGCFYFAGPIFKFLIQPYLDAGGTELMFSKMYGQFFVYVKIGLFGAVFVCFPVIASQLWAFVAPGLYAKEKRALLPFMLATPVLFLLGAALAYYVVMPAAFHFFLSFEGEFDGVNVNALPDTELYLTMVMRFILAFGISFLMPVLLMLLNRAGIVSRAQLAGARRYAWVASFVVAAVITPPDALSMMALAVPLCVLYEVALIGIWFTDRRKVREDAADEAKQDVAAAE